MSHKINSNAMRLGTPRLANAKTWKSLWFATGDEYKEYLHQDLAVKKYVGEKLRAAGVDDIVIRRPAGKVEVEVSVGRPGVAIGRGGTGIEDVTKEVRRIVKTKHVDLKVKEVRKADLSAHIIAHEIASGLERRMPPKLLVRNAISKAKSAGAKGVKIWIAGRINGALQARTIKFSDGPVPLHTLRADIDFASVPAKTLDYGVFGIKVWVYKQDQDIDKK